MRSGRVVVDVPAAASQVKLAVERLDAGHLPVVERAVVALAGRFTCTVEAVSHTRTTLIVEGRPRRRTLLRVVAARTSRRAVHFAHFGIRTGASTTPVPEARRRR